MSESAPELRRLRERLPGLAYVDAVFYDLCGRPRGKRYPIDEAEKIFTDGVLMPGPVFLLDARGACHDPLGHGFTNGDPDSPLRPIGGTLAPTRWSRGKGAQVLVCLEEEDDGGMLYDPRNVLSRVLRRFSELGWRPVVAFELEFYLLAGQRDGAGRPVPAPLGPGGRDDDGQVYALERLDAHESLFAGITAANAEMGVPASVAMSEFAPGQFEITLEHVADPLRAADHCCLFRQIVRRIADEHGCVASFLGVPFPGESGSGMHLHLSLLDDDGRNVFADTAPEGSKTLQQAIAGLLELQFDAMAIYAPNVNSYRRYRPNAFVPITRTWAANNRSVSVRIPAGSPENRRFEHRAASADANAYLVLATVLAGAHHGITHQLDPGAPSRGNACQEIDPDFPREWPVAIERFAASAKMREYLGEDYVLAYAEAKRLERAAYLEQIPVEEFDWYL